MSLDQTTGSAILPEAIPEARRQIEICNACRYCEGYCSVFPAMTRQVAFSDGEMTQLANLCHNCRGCYYACQFTLPHEFALNVPAALAEVRADSWERLAWPAPLARAMQKHGAGLALALVLGLAAMLWAAAALRPASGAGFYAVLSHGVLVAIFLPAFLLPLLAVALSLRAYWREVGGAPPRWRHLAWAFCNAARLKNLSGGAAEGCNYEKGDRYSMARRHAHQAMMWGFLLCFAATSAGTFMHYLANWPAPYPWYTPPKLLGVPGGVLMLLGGIGLLALKAKADPDLGAKGRSGGETAFVLLLILIAASGLALWVFGGTGALAALLALHLGSVLTLFLMLPYSKMVHGFYRLAALTREAQQAAKSQA